MKIRFIPFLRTSYSLQKVKIAEETVFQFAMIISMAILIILGRLT